MNNEHATKLYELPTIHKPAIPISLVVTSLRSSTYNLSTFLVKIVSSTLRKTSYHAKDSWGVCSFIKTQFIPTDYQLISIDVKSLYLAITLIAKIWDKTKNCTNLTKNGFLTATKVCLDNNYYWFNGKI